MALIGRIAGLVVLALLLAAALTMTGMIREWFNVPTLVLMAAVFCCGMLISFGLKLPLRALGAATCGDRIDDVATFAQYLNVLNRAHQVAWATGLLVFIIGLISLVRQMHDPSTIGGGIAYASLPILYAVVLAEFIINPLKHMLISRSPQAFEKSQSRVGGSAVTTVGFVAAALCLMGAQVFPLWLAYQEVSPKQAERTIETMREAFKHVDAAPPTVPRTNEDGSVTIEQRLEQELREPGDAGLPSLTE